VDILVAADAVRTVAFEPSLVVVTSVAILVPCERS
jgi:hypothetical protein